MSEVFMKIAYVSLMVLILFSGCGRGKEKAEEVVDQEPESEAQAVVGLTLVKGRLVESVRGAGLVEGIREAWVVSETQGVIRNVNFSLGDRVNKGQILLSIDDDLLVSSLRLNKQRLETARLEANAAEINRKNGSISQVQYSQIQDRLLAAESAWESAKDALGNARLSAPIGGAVASRDRSVGVGNFLGPNVRVARIVDDSSFKAEITVGEGEILKIREGDEAEIRGGDGLVRPGRVTAISAGGDNSGGFVVQVQWTPLSDDLLLSGMSVDVSVKVARGEELVIAPASALLYRGEKVYAFVDSGGKAQRREVSLGQRLGERMEVLEGLNEGETIITSGLGSLMRGVAVETTITGESGDIL